MLETKRIVTQMKRAAEGNAWHGPAVLEILDGVSAGVAATKPLSAVHSIWEIALHLIATQELILDRFRGVVRELSPEEDWPQVRKPTPAAWRSTIVRLRKNETSLRKAAGALAEDLLDEPLVPGGSSAYDNLHGHVQHDLYHAGQMAILRKAVESRIVT